MSEIGIYLSPTIEKPVRERPEKKVAWLRQEEQN
jgi:hypothetical protein